MGDRLGTPGTADKNQSRAPSLERVNQADGGGGQTLQIIFVMLLMYFHWNLAIQLLVILFVRAIHLKGKK